MRLGPSDEAVLHPIESSPRLAEREIMMNVQKHRNYCCWKLSAAAHFLALCSIASATTVLPPAIVFTSSIRVYLRADANGPRLQWMEGTKAEARRRLAGRTMRRDAACKCRSERR